VPNFVSFTASIAELARGEKSLTQSLTQPAYLMPQKPKRWAPECPNVWKLNMVA